MKIKILFLSLYILTVFASACSTSKSPAAAADPVPTAVSTPVIKLFNSGASPWVGSILEDSSGNLIIGASDDNDTSVTLIKLDSSGNQFWNKYSASGVTGVKVNGVYQSGAGYAAAGSMNASNGGLFKLPADADGTFSAAGNYDCDGVSVLSEDSVMLSDGSIVYAGFTDVLGDCSTNISYGDALLTKIGSDGTRLFRLNYNYQTGNTDSFNAVAALQSGGFAAAGSTNEYDDGSGYGGPDSAILVKTDSSGTPAWTKNYGYITDDGGNWGAVDVIETSDGGFAVLTRAGYGNQMHVIKTDASGIVETQASVMAGDNCYQGYRFVQAADGGFVIAGQGSDCEGAIIKLNSSLSKLWEYNMDGAATEIIKCSSGGYIAAGRVSPSLGVYKIFVIKLNDSGVRVW